MFLDFAELRAMQRKNLRMADWRAYVDSFMTFNEQPVLQGAGRMSHQAMTTIAHERYEQFDATRRKTEALAADRVDLHELEQVEKQLNSSRQSKKGGGRCFLMDGVMFYWTLSLSEGAGIHQVRIIQTIGMAE